MARDMIVSMVVVLPQLVIVAFVALNERWCPGCGAHELLIYRDPGTVERQEKIFEVDMTDGFAAFVAPPEAEPSTSAGPPAASEGVIATFMGLFERSDASAPDVTKSMAATPS